MTNNIKFMLLGIFLAVISMGGFILADEEEIFLIFAIALLIAAIWAFAKGFMESAEEQIADKCEDGSTKLTPALPAISEHQK